MVISRDADRIEQMKESKKERKNGMVGRIEKIKRKKMQMSEMKLKIMLKSTDEGWQGGWMDGEDGLE